MCLITVSKASKIVDAMLNNREMIESIFESNADGLGAMYKNKRGLRVVKVLPRDMKDCLDFFRSMPTDDRMLAVHWRMKTHGKVDLANCHPYDVAEGRVAMMHNGILSTGNAADPTRSDTWHFIEEYLRDPVSKSPDLVHSKAFVEMCGEYIGSNRFVFMDEAGKVSIINKKQGLSHDGVWFANTYAWDPSTFVPTYPKRQRYSYGSFRGFAHDDGDESWAEYYNQRYGDSRKEVGLTGASASATTAQPMTSIGSRLTWDPLTFLDEVHSANVDAVLPSLTEYPRRAAAILIGTHRAKLTRSVAKHEGSAASLPGPTYQRIAEACQAADVMALGNLAAEFPLLVAETICYYLDWEQFDDQREDEEHEGADDRPVGTDEDDPVDGETSAPTCRYLGCSIYVTQHGPGSFGYTIYDEAGLVWDYDNGSFGSEQDAREEAIELLAYYYERPELDQELSDMDRTLDLQFAEVMERNAEREEL